MWNWDYKIPNNWQPKTDVEWEWFLVRKINYDDFKGLQKDILNKPKTDRIIQETTHWLKQKMEVLLERIWDGNISTKSFAMKLTTITKPF